MFDLIRSSGFGFGSSIFLGMTGMEIAEKISKVGGAVVVILSILSGIAIGIYWGLKAYMLISDFIKWRKSQSE